VKAKSKEHRAEGRGHGAWGKKYGINTSDFKCPIGPVLMVLQKVVTPVKAGVQERCKYLKELDSGFRQTL
jgi:hypothetical protein